MSASARIKVENFAFYSRTLVFLAQVLFNFVIPDHDAKVFNPPNIHKRKWLDYYAEILFEGFRRWDGIYFHHIAEYGYTYENTLAFFPLFPILVKLVANSIFYPLQFIISYNIVLTISAFTLNFVIFIKSASVLYDLTLFVLKDETLAFKAAQLYSINPASIFFSAVYSETVFAFIAFKGMFFIEKKRLLRSSLLFGLSGFARSNGLVNIGFLAYNKFIDFFDIMKSVGNTKFIYTGSKVLAVVTYVLLVIGHLALQVTFAVLPFLLFQYYSYVLFCDKDASYRDQKVHILNYGNRQGYKMAHAGLSTWCHSTYPISYKYVQEHHWDVGFMRYWEYKQIPNFLLATPIALLSLSAVLSFVRKNFTYSLTLGLYEPKNMEEDVGYYKKTDEAPTLVGFHQHGVYVYVMHLLFLFLSCLFFMHIQVMTRFICSSSPVVYWFIAHLTTPPEKLQPLSLSKIDDGYKPEHMKPKDEPVGLAGAVTPMDAQDSNAINMESEYQTDLSQIGEVQLSESLLHTCALAPNRYQNGLPEDSFLFPEQNHQLRQQPQGKRESDTATSETPRTTFGEKELSEEISIQDLDDLYDWDSNIWLHRLIFVYMHLYFFVGIAAFTNFLPWT